jgi:hypothetical protein
MISDPGIGTDAAKVVADCIHSSRVKEMGLFLLKKNVAEEDMSSDIFQHAERLTDDEVKKHQSKLARTIIVFLELLQLLIARNRDLLLNLIQERRKEPSMPTPTSGLVRATTGPPGYPSNPRTLMHLGSHDGSEPKMGAGNSSVAAVEAMRDDTRSTIEDQSYGSLAGGAGIARSDAAIAVQSELQRSYISLVKALYPGISGIMQSDTPRWLKQCCQENYFSLGTYKHTRTRKLLLEMVLEYYLLCHQS